MIHRGTYDGTIYHNPVNKFCIISVKTADKEVPRRPVPPAGTEII